MVKYTLARVGSFVVIGLLLAFVLHNLILALFISAVVTSIGSLFLLKKWRDEAAGTLENSMTVRRAEKAKLRAALAGDEDPIDLGVVNQSKARDA
jgi:hypothetical protein